MPTSTVCLSFWHIYIETQNNIEHRFAQGSPNSKYFFGNCPSFGKPNTPKSIITIKAYKNVSPADSPNCSVIVLTRPTVVPQQSGASIPVKVALVYSRI